MIPLVSFLIQRGQCKDCKSKLSWYYPISELITGLMFMLAAYVSGLFLYEGPIDTFTFIYFLFLVFIFSLYIIIFLTDAKYYLVPDVVVYIAVAVTVLFTAAANGYILYTMRQSMLADEFGKYLYETGYWHEQAGYFIKSLGVNILSAFCIGIFFLFLTYITKGRGMGKGDAYIGFMVGVFVGFPYNVLGIFLGFVLGAIFSLIFIALKKKTMKDAVPFGPFILLGSLVAFMYGGYILNWYYGLLG